jgi:glycosyltransferase involved in cell wall biosynthesis
MQRGIYPVQNARALFEITRLLRRQDYQIVHTHSTNAGFLGRAAARLVGVPIVVHTVHGFPFNDLTFARPVRTLLVWLERVAADLSDHLVMVSELNKEEAVRRRIAAADKMTVIHSGIDMSLFQASVDRKAKRLELGLENDWPVVGWVGRLAEQNAPEVFLSAARQVLEEREKTNFIVVGGGDLYSEVNRLASYIPQVRLLGMRSDVPQILPIVDVFVSTCRWAGLGRAVTEAMIAKRPVIATAVNGVPEIVLNGETGLLVPPDTPGATAEKITCLLENAALARRLGENAREMVVPEFSAELMVSRVERVYEKLLSQEGIEG